MKPNFFFAAGRIFPLLFPVALMLLPVYCEARIRHVPAEFTTIQLAIAATQAGDTVLVEEGFYPEQVNFLGKNIVVASRYILDHDSAHIYNTEINRSFLNEGVKFINGEGPGARLEGFLISNCLWKAVYCNGSAPVIRHNIIRGNAAAGVYLSNSAATVSDNEIHCAPGFELGGPYDAIHVYNSGPVIERNFLQGNDPAGNVSAIDFDLWQLNLPGIQTTVRENRIVGRIFGGLPDNGLPQEISNNLVICGNGFTEGLNITDCASNLKVWNNTVIGSQLWIQGGSGPDIRNNIVAYANVGIEIWADSVTVAFNNIWNCQAAYSGIPDQTGLNGNIAADPGFLDPEHGNFHFHCWSASIDAGDPVSPYLLEPAPNGGRINQGCFGNTPEADPSVACMGILPAQIDFGYVPVRASHDSVVVIASTGHAPLYVYGVNNSDLLDFSRHYGGGTTTLQPGDTLTLGLTFHPVLDSLHYWDSVRIVTNLPDTAKVYLSGHTATGTGETFLAGMELYPVPTAGGILYLGPGNGWPSRVTAEILTLSGKVIRVLALHPRGRQPVPVDVSGLAPGSYLLRLAAGRVSTARAFVVSPR